MLRIIQHSIQFCLWSFNAHPVVDCQDAFHHIRIVGFTMTGLGLMPWTLLQ